MSGYLCLWQIVRYYFMGSGLSFGCLDFFYKMLISVKWLDDVAVYLVLYSDIDNRDSPPRTNC